MQTITNPTIQTTYSDVTSIASSWTRFMNYCRGQEKNRFLWLGVILMVHGCVLTPITVMLTLVAGPNFFLFMTAMVAMGMTVVSNLAAMPTKVTIPIFALSILIDILIILSCVVMSVV